MRCHGGFIIHGIRELEIADSREMGWKGGTTVTGLSGVKKIPLRNSRRQSHVSKAIIFIHNCYRQYPTGLLFIALIQRGAKHASAGTEEEQRLTATHS
jgi:hypothetical protein